MKKENKIQTNQAFHSNVPEQGKLQPQAVEIEEAILGACMIEQAAYFDIAHIIDPDCFYKEANRKIFKAISKLSQEASPIDILTVTNKLKESSELEAIGGPYYISQLTNRVSSSANIVHHTMIVYQKYVQREIISFADKLIKKGFEDDFDELEALYATTTEAIDNLFTGKKAVKDMMQVMTAHNKALDKRIEATRSGGITGITTGLADLDKKINGWQKYELVIIAARPGMGKTAVALKFAKAAAQANYNPLIFTLEMDDVSLADRLVCSNGGIKSENLQSGRLSNNELKQYNKSSNELIQLPIYIDDTATVDINHIRSIARSKHRKGECDMIIIDYLQLVNIPHEKYSRKNREQEVAEISRALKVLAKELGIPVLLLAQLSRAVETRGGSKIPQLSDLRESGAIEQDADKVFFVYRPEYYGFEQDDKGESTKGKMILRPAKFRNGPLGDITLRYSPDLTQIYDYDEAYEQMKDDDVAPY